MALNFAPDGKTRYAYRLRGSHDEWVDAGTRRTATYTNLPPGTYTFEVRATSDDGSWNNAAASVGLAVRPPFWRTWYAYLAYLAAIIGLLYFFHKFSIIDIQQKNALLLEHLERDKEREISETKLTFFTNVSHEFRTPLTLILGPLETVIGQTRDEGALGHLQTIRHNAHRLLRMINQIMDLRKADAGSLKLQASEADLVAFARNAAHLFDEAAEIKRIHYAFRSESPQIPAWFDEDKLENVLCNLLANAFKYTPEEGRITVEVRRAEGPEDMAELRVTDSGPGIATEDQPRVFERFFQGRAGGSNKGTGIGLALAREFAELHGGTIALESTPGEGAAFTVRLPLGRKHLRADQVRFPEPSGDGHVAAVRDAAFHVDALTTLSVAVDEGTAAGRPSCSLWKTTRRCAGTFAASCSASTASSRPEMGGRRSKRRGTTGPTSSSAT